ncbi:MAG: homogentisate 1,2-dioxygenase [Proteobacteria bacterium]|nr:homogentisate 1,2-dioxygenase [Pseudomonadota bacterium]
MKKWIQFPKVEGRASRQAHADFPEGTYEREMGKEGFFGPATHFYHQNPPTGWSNFEGPLRPRAFDTNKFKHDQSSPWKAKPLLYNAACKIRFWQVSSKMDYLARNSDGDELLFIHAGEGELYCDFGRLSYREGDYLVLPRGTMWRLEPGLTTTMMMVEATNASYGITDRGLLGPHAIFDEAILDTPVIDEKFLDQQGKGEWRVSVKRLDEISTVTFPFNPLDAVGWKGDLSVVKLNWRDIRPLMSHRYHLPPSAHTTFFAGRFVVCTFCPRPIESDPGALKVPFFHNNDDYDEFIFYHRGEFFSRDNIAPGMTTFHPTGFTHGPHPKAYQTGQKFARKETDEVAVMVDTRDPLLISKEAESIEWKDYVWSWGAKKK